VGVGLTVELSPADVGPLVNLRCTIIQLHCSSWRLERWTAKSWDSARLQVWRVVDTVDGMVGT